MTSERNALEALAIERTQCKCHPETCCCGDYTLCVDGEEVITGSKAQLEAIVSVAARLQPARDDGEVVVTRAEDGEIVMVSRQDAEGRVTKVIATTTHAGGKPARVPDGWKLVPRAATREMVSAGWDSGSLFGDTRIIKSVSDVWDAMLAAAPAPEADGVIEMSQEFSDGFNAGYNLASKPEAGQREGVEELAITLAEDVRTALDRQSCPDHYMRIAYEAAESTVIRRLSIAQQAQCRAHACKRIRVEMQAEIDRIRAQQAGNPWDSIISEIQRRAESEGADERGSDFTVTISIGEYRKATRTGSRGEGE